MNMVDKQESWHQNHSPVNLPILMSSFPVIRSTAAMILFLIPCTSIGNLNKQDCIYLLLASIITSGLMHLIMMASNVPPTAAC